MTKNDVKREVFRPTSSPQTSGLFNLGRPNYGKTKRIEDFFPLVVSKKSRKENAGSSISSMLQKQHPSELVLMQQQQASFADRENIVTVHRPVHNNNSQHRQLYLDFGQKSFAKQIICLSCGMLLVHGVEEDFKAHEKICREYKEGVSFSGWAKERVIWRKSNSNNGCVERIIEIRSSDPLPHRRKVDEIKKIVDQEMGFIPVASSWLSGHIRDTSKRRCYLYISNQRRVIGLCIVDLISEAFPLINSSTTSKRQNEMGVDEKIFSKISSSLCLERSNDSCMASLGVYQIWCHSKYRRTGVSRTLVDAARTSFYFGTSVPKSRIAFSSPTADGINFAKKYCCSNTPILVYDC